MKFTYELKVTSRINMLIQNWKNEKLEVDTRYLENYNICPMCQTEMKTYRGEVKGVGAVTAYMPYDENKKVEKVILYCLCKSCSKQMTTMSKTKASEEFLLSKLAESENE